MFNKLKIAANEGEQAFKDGFDLSDNPYDAFSRDTEDQAFEWICAFINAEREQRTIENDRH